MRREDARGSYDPTPRDRTPSTPTAPPPVQPIPPPSVSGLLDPRDVPVPRADSRVLDLIDCLQVAPPRLNDVYARIVVRTARWLGHPTIPDLEGQLSGQVNLTTDDERDKFRNDVNRVRAWVLALVNDADSLVVRARRSGFELSKNPFRRAMEFNSGRDRFTPVQISEQEQSLLARDVQDYITLLAAERDGKLQVTSWMFLAQLSSLDLSHVTAVNRDVARTDALVDASRELDFSSRVPRLLFISDFRPVDRLEGKIVGWLRMRDASFYHVNRTNLFTGEEVEFYTDPIVRNTAETSGEEIVDFSPSTSPEVRRYAETFVIPFLGDSVAPGDVELFLDRDVRPEGFYIYKVRGETSHIPRDSTIFDVEVRAFSDVSTLVGLRAEFESQDRTEGADVISPWPFLSSKLLGDASLGWFLAAVNVRARVRTNDRPRARSLSYTSAQFDFILDEVRAGRFLVPTQDGIESARRALSSDIIQRGVPAVLVDVLSMTGILYDVEGKEPGSPIQGSRSGLAEAVIRAVDPRDAVLNPLRFAEDLRALTGLAAPSRTTDIRFPVGYDPSALKDDAPSSTGIDALLGSFPRDSIDVTTFDGIGNFVNVVRKAYDALRNRPVFYGEQPVVIDEITPPERLYTSTVPGNTLIVSPVPEPTPAPSTPSVPPPTPRPSPLSREQVEEEIDEIRKSIQRKILR